ncbi:hypothetical protein BD309DRAFT_946053 [Dichomitus squalens]|uniref:Uncharacterized protein n=1 Tax=Dichomitus squalens TaxID=114155 RepID=A0A4Q9MMX8_9APHY|nr:hypothetical protein BD311DRAFT_308065 [Dichomitus squalens]TBU50179.1 hypothetical protein BD309DRAFT_946053 [Dichomitus squalens]TBU66200.1 hypothetical protein BD310DRAFT_46926 [Dichomitus squalens]
MSARAIMLPQRPSLFRYGPLRALEVDDFRVCQCNCDPWKSLFEKRILRATASRISFACTITMLQPACSSRLTGVHLSYFCLIAPHPRTFKLDRVAALSRQQWQDALGGAKYNAACVPVHRTSIMSVRDTTASYCTSRSCYHVSLAERTRRQRVTVKDASEPIDSRNAFDIQRD